MDSTTLSVRLPTDVRDVLEKDARDRGVGLATYLRTLATERAHALRRARIRAESAEVGAYIRASHKASAEFGEYGTPTAEV